MKATEPDPGPIALESEMRVTSQGIINLIVLLWLQALTCAVVLVVVLK